MTRDTCHAAHAASGSKRAKRGNRRRAQVRLRRLRFESLEDRRLLATDARLVADINPDPDAAGSNPQNIVDVSVQANDGMSDSNVLLRGLYVLTDGSIGDALLIGDQSDATNNGNDTVQRFDAKAGQSLGTFVAGGGRLAGPRGMLFRDPSTLLVANQNVNLPMSGEVDQYNGQTGAFLGPLVPASDPHAPYAPRGMVLKNNILYVADVAAGDPATPGAPAPEGRIREYDVRTGAFLGDLTPAGYGGHFHPRGLVFGPDGMLYVSLFDPDTDATGAPVNLGYGAIVRIDPASGVSGVVNFNNGDTVQDPGETADLHRPEGLVFGPDGRLYVTSFRGNASDTDKILVLDPSSGAWKDEIALDEAGQPRAYAQALLFGPGGRLYVPINGNGPDTGSVRSYDVATKTYTVFVQSAADQGPLASPWYLTFGQTNPATLAYSPGPLLSGLETAALNFTVNGGHTEVTQSLTVSDLNFATLSSATVQITRGYQQGQDVLLFQQIPEASALTSTWDPTTGTLTLSGSDSVENYQRFLRWLVTYQNTSANPAFGTRTVRFQVNHGSAASNALSREIAVNDSLSVGGAVDPAYSNVYGSDQTKVFDATTGQYRTYVPWHFWEGFQPRGVLFSAPGILVAAFASDGGGEVLRHGVQAGQPGQLPALVAVGDPNSPWMPGGMVLQGTTLFVADAEAGISVPPPSAGAGESAAGAAPGTPAPAGRIRRYDIDSGAFLGDLTADGYGGQFHPRGIVFGPDGMLYVSLYDPNTDALSQCEGQSELCDAHRELPRQRRSGGQQ